MALTLPRSHLCSYSSPSHDYLLVSFGLSLEISASKNQRWFSLQTLWLPVLRCFDAGLPEATICLQSKGNSDSPFFFWSQQSLTYGRRSFLFVKQMEFYQLVLKALSQQYWASEAQVPTRDSGEDQRPRNTQVSWAEPTHGVMERALAIYFVFFDLHVSTIRVRTHYLKKGYKHLGL